MGQKKGKSSSTSPTPPTSPTLSAPIANHLLRYDYLYKIIVIGDQSVGKTNFTMRFCENTFGPTYIGTIGIDFKVRTVDVDGRKIKLQIWDTAGQERFQTITQVYYRGSHGVIFVYDISDASSFENLNGWMKIFEEITGHEAKKLIVGNKADKYAVRQVPYENAQKVAKALNCMFMEVSAKTGYNVEEAFLTLARSIKQHQESVPPNEPTAARAVKLEKKQKTVRRRNKSFFSRCEIL